MKISAIALALLPSVASAFAPVQFASRASKANAKSYGLKSAVAPERVAPDAGKVPEWEGRTGLTEEEFMASDMSKPDASGMWECPLTRWNSEE